MFNRMIEIQSSLIEVCTEKMYLDVNDAALGNYFRRLQQ